MTKKDDVRVITASKNIRNVIDVGAAVDADLKDSTKKDKKLKAQITAAAKEILELDEVTIRLEGGENTALVSVAETYTLNPNTPLMPEIMACMGKGQLEGVMEKKQSIIIPPESIVKAAEVLKQAGIEVMMSESYPINAEGFRTFKSDFGDKEFVSKLVKEVSRDVSYRVKYEVSAKAELENTKEMGKNE